MIACFTFPTLGSVLWNMACWCIDWNILGIYSIYLERLWNVGNFVLSMNILFNEWLNKIWQIRVNYISLFMSVAVSLLYFCRIVWDWVEWLFYLYYYVLSMRSLYTRWYAVIIERWIIEIVYKRNVCITYIYTIWITNDIYMVHG